MLNNQSLTLEQIDAWRQNSFRPVVVGCIINDRKLLMVYKKEYNLWFLPQGGVDNGEMAEEAISRELSEELGLKFINNCDNNYRYIGQDKVVFPGKTQGIRALMTDSGVGKVMKGKKYFFYQINCKNKDIDLAETEFDNYKWVDYKTGSIFVDKIYQKGKKRITFKVLNVLKDLNIIL